MKAHISEMKLSALNPVAYNQHLGVLYVLAGVFLSLNPGSFFSLTGSVYKLFEFLSEIYLWIKEHSLRSAAQSKQRPQM